MAHRLIRVSQTAYLRLAREAGMLQARLGHRVSLSDALDYLLSKKAGRVRKYLAQMRQKRNLAGRGPKRKGFAPPVPSKTTPVVLTRKNYSFSSRRDVF